MEIKKSIQCTTEPFEDLLRYKETIDFRLDESAWADLKIGDLIEYWEDLSGWDNSPAPNARKVNAKITDIFRATSFLELIDILPTSLVREEKDQIIEDLRQWWSREREIKTGVLGFRVALV